MELKKGDRVRVINTEGFRTETIPYYLNTIFTVKTNPPPYSKGCYVGDNTGARIYLFSHRLRKVCDFVPDKEYEELYS